MDTQALMQAPSISRYDTARILNFIECRDCVNPSPTMQQTYTSQWRTTFSRFPGRDFDDIVYGEAYYQ